MSTLIEKVQAIYAAFGRGDGGAVLEHIADDCEWEYAPVVHDVPWLQKQRGRAGVGAFLQSVGTELEFATFAPKTFLEAPGLVVVLVDVEATVRRTGRAIHEIDEVHLWHFDRAGRVARFRHAADTFQHARAWAT
jgi:ketosteroid isomerase-like protein